MWFTSKGKKDRSKTVAPSFIAAGVKIDGDISSEGDIDLAGTVEGNVTAARLVVCGDAALNGTARARTAVINGSLNGRLAAAEVALGSAAKVGADITYVSLRRDEGAVFVGQSRRVENIDAIPADLRQLPAPVSPEKRVFDHLPRKIGALLIAAAITFPFGAAAETLPFPPSDQYRIVLGLMAALAAPQRPAAPLREQASPGCDRTCVTAQAHGGPDKAKNSAQ